MIFDTAELDQGTGLPSSGALAEIDGAAWTQLIVELRPMLAGDIAVHEAGCERQLAHYESGIRIATSDDTIFLWSSYSLGDAQRDRTAQKMRDIALSCEMVTGRIAVAVLYDQPDLLLGDMAGRSRIHGYALFGRHGGPTHGVVRTMRLPASTLPDFDSHAIRRNAAGSVRLSA